MKKPNPHHTPLSKVEIALFVAYGFVIFAGIGYVVALSGVWR